MRIWITAAAVLAAVLLRGAPASAAQPPTQPGDCAARGDLHFVCGPMQPEDLVQVPSTPWIIASGMAGHGEGGVFLINANAKTALKLTQGEQIQARHDAATYPACAEPPAAASFAAHGLSLRPDGAGRDILYVVGHGGREAIEVFDVQAAGTAPPTLTWIGCVRMPASAGTGSNSVTSVADGTIYATVLNRPGATFQQMLAGQHTGDVYEWKVGSAQFERVPGLSLAGNNGITASPDGRELLLLASGAKQLMVFSRADPSHPLRTAQFTTFAPDNVHLGPHGDYIVAGMRDAEPACGGPPKAQSDLARCNRGSIVVLVNPHSMAFHVLYSGRANPDFTGVATGLVIGKQLWLSSFVSDRVAYVNLPQ